MVCLPLYAKQQWIFKCLVHHHSYHTVLLLIKELTSQQMMSNNGPILMEFTCPFMFPIILMQLA